MASAAITFLLESVGQLRKHHVALISGAENELKQLEADLKSLKAFLHDAAKMPNKPEGVVKDMERRIRVIVYEAEDTIDSCTALAAAETNKNFLRRAVNAKRVSLAEEVKSLREKKVIHMVQKARKFTATAIDRGSETSDQESPSKPTRVKSPNQWRIHDFRTGLQIISEQNVVGFEEDEKKIISSLLDGKEEFDVISITGMPGVGKTALARKIFKNENITREFPNRIWVHVTQTPNYKDVFLNILKEFTSDDLSGQSDRALTETVQHYLKHRKFLLVLDDVWTTEAWEKIKVVLSESNNMGKVLITSREKSVGKKASRLKKPHELPFLNDDQSWELLQYEVFGKLDLCHEDLEVVGKCIARECYGSPLAIAVIGGILLDQISKNQEISGIRKAWNKVSENVSEFLKNDKERRVSDIVELSYKGLPDELRECFLYLGVFPEDYEISVWTLTRLWIAEGLIQYCQGQSLEETAEENLKDLISRNLVLVGRRNLRGEVKTCRIHDVIHAFCSSKASSKEQNLFQEMKILDGAFEPPISDLDQYRRVCIHSDILENFLARAEEQKSARLRSLLCYNKAPAKLTSRYAPTIFELFDLLRVLDSKSVKLDHISKRVGKLFHLRYITLSIDTLKVLSDAFSNLWNLQTLVIHTRSESLAIKANIWKMVQLRHLKTNAVITQIPQGNGEGGKNLQTLCRISPECCTEDLFNRVPHLRRLGIQGNLDDLFKTKSLGKLNQLEKLKLVNTYHDSTSKESMRLPEPGWFPPKLKMLTIAGANLDSKQLSKLAKIETLQVLKLKNNEFPGKSWEGVDGGFRDLHFLVIEETNLFLWTAPKDSFPSLRHLGLNRCRQLKEIPEGAAERLEKLHIEHVGKSAVASARKIEGKKQKEVQRRAARSGGGFKLSIGAGCE